MLDEVTVLYRRLGHSTQKHIHAHILYECLAHTQTCMYCVHIHMHTHDVTSRCTAGIEGRRGGEGAGGSKGKEGNRLEKREDQCIYTIHL